MKFLLSVISLVVMIALVAAQSKPAAHANQPNPRPDAQALPAGVVASAGTAQASLLHGLSNAVSLPARLHARDFVADPLGSIPLIFAPGVDYNSGGFNAASIAIGDLNGDGHADLVMTGLQCEGCDFGVVGVLLNKGDGTFQSPVSYSSGGFEATSVLIADVNGDGKPDLVVTNIEGPSGGFGGVSVLLGNGNGTFQSAVSYNSGGLDAQSLAIGDVNGDGKLDLVVANLCQIVGNQCFSAVASVLLGNGDGTFQPAVNYDTAGLSYSLAIADLNGDGKLDLVAAGNGCEGPSCGPEISVLLGNGDGTFQPAVSYNSGGGDTRSVAIADINGDGHPDLVVANQCESASNCGSLSSPGGVSVLLGTGTGTFKPAVAYSSGGSLASFVAVADVNDDGKLDLVASNLCYGGNCNLGVLLGNGDGTFQSPGSYNSGGFYSMSVAIGDVNGDGKPDLLVANQCSDVACSTTGSVGVLLNNDIAPSTTTSLTSSVNPVDALKSVTYTATVAEQSGGPLNGTVTFTDGYKTIATATLANNQATYSTSYTKKQLGAHPITASFPGSFQIAMGSQSATLTEYARGALSKTTVATSGSPSLVGQPVTFTATITSSGGAIPDGEQVTFYDGTNALASAATIGGKAIFTTSTLSAKNHSIRAAYLGDTTFEPSSGQVLQVVDLYSTTTTLSSSPNPSIQGQTVTLTAKVSSGAPVTPTGKVMFKNGSTALGTATLSGGKAILTTTKLPAGTLTITANYSGNTENATSSGTTTQTVN